MLNSDPELRMQEVVTIPIIVKIFRSHTLF